MSEVQSINYVDIALLGVILISVTIGVIRGFTQEVLGIIGWLGAVFTAIYALPFVRPLARGLISSPLIADVTAGVLIFLVALIILTILCRSFATRIKESALGGIDRSLGLLFGVVRGFFLLSLVYLMAVSLTKITTWPAQARSAKAIPFLDYGAKFIKTLLPEDFRPKHVDQYQHDLRSAEEIMNNLSRLTPKQKDSQDQPLPYSQSQKEKMEALLKSHKPSPAK